jgi:hypothetical protein
VEAVRGNRRGLLGHVLAFCFGATVARKTRPG